MLLLETLLPYEFTVIAVILVGAFLLARMKTKEKLILFYVATIFVFDLWAATLAIEGKKNWFIYNILIGLEFLLLTVYLNMILKSKKLKNYLNVSCALYFVFSVIYVFLNGINTLMLPFSIVNGSILSFFFLLFLIYGQAESKWTKSPDNWFALGSIFYKVGTIPFLAMYIYLINKKEELTNTLFLVINMGLSHLRFLLILVGFLMIIKRKQNKPEISAASI
jgi:hypothetical protein